MVIWHKVFICIFQDLVVFLIQCIYDRRHLDIASGYIVSVRRFIFHRHDAMFIYV